MVSRCCRYVFCRRRADIVSRTPLIEDPDPELISSSRLTSAEDQPRPVRVEADAWHRFKTRVWRVMLCLVGGIRARPQNVAHSIVPMIDLEQALTSTDEELLQSLDEDVEALVLECENLESTWVCHDSSPKTFTKPRDDGLIATAGRLVLPFSPERVLGSLLSQDPAFVQAVHPTIESATMLRRLNSSTFTQHVVYKKVFGIAKRDTCFLVHHRPLPDGNGYVLSSCSRAGEVESSHVRITYSAPSGWVLRAVEPNHTCATFISHIHMGGSVPKLISIQISKAMPQAVYRLSVELAEHPPSANPTIVSTRAEALMALDGPAPSFDADLLVIPNADGEQSPQNQADEALVLPAQADADEYQPLSGEKQVLHPQPHEAESPQTKVDGFQPQPDEAQSSQTEVNGFQPQPDEAQSSQTKVDGFQPQSGEAQSFQTQVDGFQPHPGEAQSFQTQVDGFQPQPDEAQSSHTKVDGFQPQPDEAQSSQTEVDGFQSQPDEAQSSQTEVDGFQSQPDEADEGQILQTQPHEAESPQTKVDGFHLQPHEAESSQTQADESQPQPGEAPVLQAKAKKKNKQTRRKS